MSAWRGRMGNIKQNRHAASAFVMVLGLCQMFLGSISAQVPSSRSFDPTPFLAPQHLVAIAPGRRLDVHCMGAGGPTIVLEAGYAGDSTAWRFVQPLLAKHTRVCSYDRAGERFSDPGPHPRDVEAMSRDLHALVQAASIAKPFVLVGHSMGGMTALLYADLYPNDLAGLVLLDPGTMYDFERFSALQDWPQYVQNTRKGLAGLRHCIALAADPTQKQRVLSECMWREASFPPQLNQVQDELVERPSFWRSLLSTDLALRATGTEYRSEVKEFSGEMVGAEPALKGISSLDQTELQEHSRSLGSLPLLIVSVAERPDPSRPAATVHREWSLKTENYEDLAKLSSRSNLVAIAGTGHNLQFDAPEKTAALVLAFVDPLR